MRQMTVILDAGHRPQTKGKRSPDGRLVEHEWAVSCRERVAKKLESAGVAVELLPYSESATETGDLNWRVRSVNERARGKRCAVVSIHCNAAGSDGNWQKARGWSVFVAPNASEDSKLLAEAMAARARSAGLKVRQQWPNVGYWVQSLAICRDTSCPAVLVENLFMDNAEDCAYLLSEEGMEQCAEVMARGVMDYLKG